MEEGGALIEPEAWTKALHDSLPFARWMAVRLERAERGRVRVRLPYREEFLRPGGVVNGPMMMALADVAMYAAVMSADPRGAGAVTATQTTNFLRRTTGRDLLADARLLKGGRTLAVIEVTISADGEESPVAHVTGTYAFAPERR